MCFVKNLLLMISSLTTYHNVSYWVTAGDVGQSRYLYWPQFTVFQVTMAVAIPLEIPGRKVNINMALQTNYQLPFTMKEFVNPIHWATTNRFFGNSRSLTDGDEKYFTGNQTRVRRDVTAGEMYRILQEVFSLQGHHEHCLQKMVCQMAKFPFRHQEDNLLSEILQFIFTPSIHQSFDENEAHLQKSYELAERLGTQDEDCDFIYINCKSSPLDYFSYLDEENE